MPLGLIDILKVSGFDLSLRTKLLRHQDRRYDIRVLRRHNWLEIYQAYQSKPKFHDAVQLVSFYGLSGTRAGFYGVYKVLGHVPASQGPVIEAYAQSKEWGAGGAGYFYSLKRDERFDDLRDRLIIDWGQGTLAWVQKLDNKPVLEIKEPGRSLPPFEDYLEFSLTYAELQDQFAKEEAHRDWRIPLSSVAGVYLVLAEDSGDLYIGSAYGESGIWGRWRNYASSGDGGNVKLTKLIQENPAYPERFRFSVLQILPRTMAREEVIKRETLYKDKLGSKAHGLNSN